MSIFWQVVLAILFCAIAIPVGRLIFAVLITLLEERVESHNEKRVLEPEEVEEINKIKEAALVVQRQEGERWKKGPWKALLHVLIITLALLFIFFVVWVLLYS